MGLVDRINRAARALPEWPAYVIGMVPAALLIWQAPTGGLGIDPVKALEHRLGLTALQFLIATLCVTPLMRFAGIRLLKFRRALGLLAFAYAILHLLVWGLLDMQLLWTQIAADLVKRWYIMLGFAALALMVPLAVTSTKGAIRRMGARWRQLHLLVYPAGLLAAVHFVLQEKVWTTESLVYAGILAALCALRVARSRLLAVI
ncbi:protein-methionine-sulfoxide reductase heme-binding subunit MsrQ [Actibacterium ureilyticum]|uniref:protein-methionine-sulfoxide reductase heme-binding subunit MsrQ n=1 Tax=Actibacterium ureilyticum TaxID=1590614 RepID=UPI000BAAE53D|nr:protein-methionine-sulfoxide reductase heme-binding subunit MsrQ [Actibacterium ureilyticum]